MKKEIQDGATIITGAMLFAYGIIQSGAAAQTCSFLDWLFVGLLFIASLAFLTSLE